MSADDETDWLVRAVAAAPAEVPPLHLVTALVVLVPDRSLVERAQSIVRPAGITLTDRAQEGLVATFGAGDGVVDAASSALALRDALPAARIVVITAPTEWAALAQAATLMKAALAGEILIDRATSDLLDAGFDLREAASGWVLLGRRAAKTPATELVATEPLARAHRRLRFADAAVEAHYRSWYDRQSLPLIRIAQVVSIVFTLLSVAAIRFISPSTWPEAAATAMGAILVAVLTIACTHKPRLTGWILPIAAFSALVNGLANVVLYAWCVDLPKAPGVAAAVTWISILFGAALYRLRPEWTLAATVPFVLLMQSITTSRFHAGRLDSHQLTQHSFTLWLTLAVGVIVSVALDLDSRRAYRRARIIELQRQAIERLQQAELERQQAERARDPQEAVARLAEGPRQPARLSVGERVDERYRIVRTLGAGAMGQVHEVERLSDGQRLALKTITCGCDRTSLARFAREGQIAAALDHPNLVPVLDLGVTASGMLYLVMELVTGSSLEAARGQFGDRRWALPVLRQIAEALVAIHARGILHRDLKPSNILLDGERVKVADFGLAGLVDSTLISEADTLDPNSPLASDADLTRTGAIMGTPRYMAPELAHGARAAGPSADVFSLGVVAYELLSNQRPFEVSPALERLKGHPAPTPRPIAEAQPDLPRDLASLVDACLRETPEARPSAEVIAGAIGRMLA
jgi:hypothetical protein